MSAAIGKKAGTKTVGSPTVSPRKRSQELGLNARKVVSKRYSLKDSKGHPFEDWAAIVSRVVGHVSKAETKEKRDEFFAAMSDVMLAREFIPNTPCLVNAGKANGQLAACFVLDVPDSLSGIMDHAKAAATIHQTGGGTGMTYEFLRPLGAMVSSATGVASGPVSFMNIVNQ
ncbi:MAG TPA: ribonucleotide reductase N-terminal alpha domain-containing protein, partial [Pyrinomonadaceae bacterium]|nr:ribonucleotide reductase N-terminal alpha domain-containing protein [Pyrinomonadaceae bacterium]